MMSEIIVTIISAVSTIIVAVVGVCKVGNRASEKVAEENKKQTEAISGKMDCVSSKVGEISTKVDRLERHDQEQYESILRLTITDTDMPVSERLAAGKIYVEELGLDGQVRDMYYELKEKVDGL